MTGTTRVICVTAAFQAIDHLLNEMISYVCVLHVAPLYLRVYVGTTIEVSVSKAYFIPHTPSYSDYRMIRKSSAVMVEHALYCKCTQYARTNF